MYLINHEIVVGNWGEKVHSVLGGCMGKGFVCFLFLKNVGFSKVCISW